MTNTTKGVGILVDGEVQYPETNSLGGTWPIFKQFGDELYGVWWRKNPGTVQKHLYVTAATVQEPRFTSAVTVSQKGQPLPKLGLAGDGKGSVVLVYIDESSGRYQIRSNRSQDRGATWLAEDQRLDREQYEAGVKVTGGVVDPSIAYAGDRYVAIWKEAIPISQDKMSQDKTLFRTVSSVSLDRGATWSTPAVIMAHERLFAAEDRLLVDRGKFLFLGILNREVMLYQSYDGVNWAQKPSFNAPEKASWMVTEVDQGVLHFTVLGGEGKPHLFYGKYLIDEGRWEVSAKRLDTKPSDDSRSNGQAVVALNNNVVVVAWEDYRNFRPRIYINYSWDKGTTWQEQPALAEPLAGHGSSHYPHLVAKSNGEVQLWLSRSESTAHPGSQQLLRKTIRFDADHRQVTGLEDDEHLPVDAAAQNRRLEERVNSFWEARKQGREGDAYDFYDPFFREKTDKAAFLRQQLAALKILDYHFEKVDIAGNLAKVHITVRYEILKQKVLDMEMESPP
ncbi:MAG: hypothetical protein WCP34_17650, partial [Pseudomonadota bacterium]